MRRLLRMVPVLSAVVLLLLLALPMAVSAEPEAGPSAAWCSAWYVIKPGDTLNKIAARYGTTAWYLARLNGISNPDFIRSGRSICVRPAAPSACGIWYTIKWGDTLWKIGKATGWSAAYLARVNGIADPDRIWAGRKLWIPCH
ncbi:MAG: LysM peptidoglycan-binding domain-containing protein [Anaerolineae bacterium]